MATPTKAQLTSRAKALGIRVDETWTRAQIEQAIELASEEDGAEAEEDEATLPAPAPPPAPAHARAPAIAPPAPVAPVVPPAAPAPPAPRPVVFDPKHPRTGAGRYRVLWTVTLPGGPVHDGEVPLTDAQARSLVAQGAVVHVDEYDAYCAYQRAAAGTPRQAPHPAQVPVGAGNYRTVGGVMRDGKEIPHGTVAHFSAEEVAALTRPGMIAIEFPD